MRRAGVIVLAAGRSTRFSNSGAHKLLARIGTESVIRHAARAALTSGVGEVVVVTGSESEAVAGELHGLGVRLIHAPDFASGMAESLRCGLDAVRDTADAVVVSLGDQPTVRPEAYRQVVARWRDSNAAIVVPRYLGPIAPSHPVLFDASTYDELLALSGDVGARALIARDPARVAHAALDWPPPRDIDTPTDLDAVANDMCSDTESTCRTEPNVKRSE